MKTTKSLFGLLLFVLIGLSSVAQNQKYKLVGLNIYVEPPITNLNWTHALKTPVVNMVNPVNVVCNDLDGDGY